MRSENVIILKIEKSLNEIRSLLKKDYSCINETIVNCDIGINEKSFNHRWESIGDYFIIQNARVANQDIKLIKAIAIIESNRFSGIDKIRIGNNIPLPKDQRVVENKSLVIFVEYLGSTFIIVNGPKSIESKIRTILMEQKRGIETEWGKVYNKDIGIYIFDKSFYKWALTQNGQELIDGDYKLKLIDFKGFKSKTIRNANTFSGEGSNIDKEIPFKSVVSLNEEIGSLHMELKVNDRTSYSFELYSDGRLKVITTLCGDFFVQNPKIYSDEEIYLNIYFEIIPFLVKKFNESKRSNWFEKEKELMQKYSQDIIDKMSMICN